MTQVGRVNDVTLCDFFTARSFVNENGGADTNQGTACGNGGGHVVGHAHRQRIRLRTNTLQCFQRITHLTEYVELARVICLHSRDRHQTTQRQVWHRHNVRSQFGDLAHGNTGFAGFIADIDLNQHLQRR